MVHDFVQRIVYINSGAIALNNRKAIQRRTIGAKTIALPRKRRQHSSNMEILHGLHCTFNLSCIDRLLFRLYGLEYKQYCAQRLRFIRHIYDT